MNKNAITTGDTTGSGKNKIQPEDPNKIPYETKRNFAEHFFSVPAKLWHLIWLPLGESVIWMEQNHIHQQLISFFFNDDFIGRTDFPESVPEKMKESLEKLKEEGLRDNVKVLIGGAPTSQAFADQIGADAHCKDAFEAIEVMKTVAV